MQINKTTNDTKDHDNSQSIKQPKQQAATTTTMITTYTPRQNPADLLDQYAARIKSLERLNDQLTKIIESTQVSQYSQLVNKLNEMQSQHSAEISCYRLKLAQMQAEMAFYQKQNQGKFDDLIQNANRLALQNGYLKKQLTKSNQQIVHYREQYHKSKKMLKNQQALIDSFRLSIEQQIVLEKQVLKSNYKEKQTQMKNHYEQKLKKLQEKFRKNVQQINHEAVQDQYKSQLKELGLYLSNKKSSDLGDSISCMFMKKVQSQGAHENAKKSNKQHKTKQNKVDKTNQSKQNIRPTTPNSLLNSTPSITDLNTQQQQKQRCAQFQSDNQPQKEQSTTKKINLFNNNSNSFSSQFNKKLTDTSKYSTLSSKKDISYF